MKFLDINYMVLMQKIKFLLFFLLIFSFPFFPLISFLLSSIFLIFFYTSNVNSKFLNYIILM